MPRHDIPAPANWEKFEDLCLGLWRLLWNDPKARKHGRSGQSQAGVDFYGQPNGGHDWEGVQCKLKSQILGKKLTRKEIDDEVAKARTFEPALAGFTIATTAPRDRVVEKAVREISAKQQEDGSFRVNVAFWEDILEEIERYPNLLRKLIRNDPSLDETRRHYLNHLRRFCQRLPVATLGDNSSLGHEKILDQVYIELDTTTPARPAEDLEKAEGWEDITSKDQDVGQLSAKEAAEGVMRLVLLGGPGAGKTTFIKALIAQISEEQLSGSLATSDSAYELLPVLIELKVMVPTLLTFKLEEEPLEKQNERLAGAILDVALDNLNHLDAQSFFQSFRETLISGQCLMVFDGLDEVPEGLRAMTRMAIIASIQRYQFRRVIITCRSRSYQGDLIFPHFVVHTLAPFDEGKIRLFAKSWYGVADSETAGEAERRAGDLQQAALSGDIIEMARNPMLLTAIALIHEQHRRLPKERVRLYHLAVELLLVRWQAYKFGSGPSSTKELFVEPRRWLERLAFESLDLEGHPGESASIGLERGRVLDLLEREDMLGNAARASDFLDYVDQRAGLLVGRGGPEKRSFIYSFVHRTFQEYLAACYLAASASPGRLCLELAEKGETWSLAARLCAEELFYNKDRKHAALDLIYYLYYPGADGHRETKQERASLWAGYIAVLVGREAIEGDIEGAAGGKKYLVRLRRRLGSLLDGSLTITERADAGRVLAKLDDYRDGVVDLDAMQFCRIPAGDFYCGGKESIFGGEMGGFKQYTIAYNYCLARYPVTVSQFAYFTQAGGYRQSEFWLDAMAAEVWEKGRIVNLPEQPRDYPRKYGDPFELSNHPVVGVTWYEAMAFTKWLTKRWRENGKLSSDWVVGLPSEAEWEKAARGGFSIPKNIKYLPVELATRWVEDNGRAMKCSAQPRRRYPWGERADFKRANTRETAIGSTSPVGCFPRGRSPHGCEEMAGNVLEWTRDSWGPFQVEAGRTSASSEVSVETHMPRVLRGGNFTREMVDSSCSAREGFLPMLRTRWAGFRVAILPAEDDRDL